ncbi:MAG: tetratricopeptide repeat protein [Rhodospirillaceae bacterium]
MRGGVPIAACIAAIAMVGAGGLRLAADLLDIPGDGAARALRANGPFLSDAPGLVLATRTGSLRIHPSAERQFAVGRARMAAKVASEFARGGAAGAFAEGLRLAPARGTAWAEYARALRSAGRDGDALAAYEMSVRRAPHDPVARRLRSSPAW